VNTKIAVVMFVILASITSVGYSTRAFMPTPGGYLARLEMLRGWSSRGYYAFNCSGLLTNAHGEEFLTERQMYAGEGNLEIIAEFRDRGEINEAELEPGDIAAFQGPNPQIGGLHVAAFEGRGAWIDSDSRRGFVATYQLKDKPSTDPWFQGRVRILRWKDSSKTRFDLGFFDREQAAIASEGSIGKS
jgi:hypothetical protein